MPTGCATGTWSSSGSWSLGLVGLALNALVLFVTVSRLGMDLMFGKGVAAGCTFIANFALRRQLLFRTPTAAA